MPLFHQFLSFYIGHLWVRSLHCFPSLGYQYCLLLLLTMFQFEMLENIFRSHVAETNITIKMNPKSIPVEQFSGCCCDYNLSDRFLFLPRFFLLTTSLIRILISGVFGSEKCCIILKWSLRRLEHACSLSMKCIFIKEICTEFLHAIFWLVKLRLRISFIYCGYGLFLAFQSPNAISLPTPFISIGTTWDFLFVPTMRVDLECSNCDKEQGEEIE